MVEKGKEALMLLESSLIKSGKINLLVGEDCNPLPTFSKTSQQVRICL